MFRTKAIALVAGMVTLLAGSASFAAVTHATVTGGEVEGRLADGIVAYKGIPFAAPPVGPLRWKAPQPVSKWSGVHQATDFGPACMQAPAMLAMLGSKAAISEDCLYLNVWTGAATLHERRPVMVWIYGGGFSAGLTDSPSYDGTAFAKQGVVLVSIAYRVGPFGFLADPALTREGRGSSGNYGLQDMIAGLEWVKQNIAQFGGDPSRVTIFGESAGGIAVSMLAASPAAKGLFQRAISESGGSFGPPLKGTEAGANVRTLADAEALGKGFLAKLGANDIAAARALPAAKIQAAMGPGLTTTFWPNFDGKVLLGDQYLLYSNGQFNDTPVLIGTNSDEGALFARPGVTPASFEAQVRAGYGARADEVLKAYPHADDAQVKLASKRLFRDSTFAWPTWTWATLQSQHGRSKAWVYYFDRRSPQSPDGASHASEIGFVFGTLAVPGPLGGPATAGDRKLSELINRYWVNFATSGNPNGQGLPVWPAFDASTQQSMVFDTMPGAQLLPNLPQLKAMDDYFSWRRGNDSGG